MSSNVRSGVITLLHTACGAGILAMPYAYKPFGLVPGFGMLIFCGLCSLLGLLLQARVSQYVPSKSASFFSLTQLINPQLSIIFDLAIAVKCFGVGISYMIVIGDLVPQIMETVTSNTILLNRNFHITLIMLLIVSPLCFLKSLNSLRYASSVALSSVAYLCVLVIIHFLFPSEEINELKGTVSIGLPTRGNNPLTTLPIFVFAYTCHHNAFSVFNEQKNSGFDSTKKIALYSISFAFTLYLTIGGAGYLTFGDKIVGNIVTLYPQSFSTTIGRVAIVLLVMLAYPLQCHPARASVNHIILYMQHRFPTGKVLSIAGESSSLISPGASDFLNDELIEEGSQGQSQQPEESQGQLKGVKFYVITTSILIASYICAISISSLARVLAIVGATGSTSISFILPGIFGYCLIGKEFVQQDMPPRTKLFRYSGMALAIWGVFVMIACLTATLRVGASH
ncbi:hypothetical protein HG535_0E04320 [Zygotorulaspora mrakii]|uniref:Amino acid transporter transmembrane domain-containing protein n=1 Tax=Zygotorulaspora mrakii TaxID=42260 RepID=A0A7H9B3W5_ZYGMR|nr:uncharacterized protein HG535_0E04320 [Zygotorulaspora mrakii]QLG73348.1 hypothetical protein HG535_0E04320 [Zygotorulaspora mrakii]